MPLWLLSNSNLRSSHGKKCNLQRNSAFRVGQTGGPARHGTGPLGPTDNRAVPDRPACRSRGPGTARRPGNRAGPARLLSVLFHLTRKNSKNMCVREVLIPRPHSTRLETLCEGD
jgi:hypothetical protein